MKPSTILGGIVVLALAAGTGCRAHKLVNFIPTVPGPAPAHRTVTPSTQVPIVPPLAP